jgi:hypothetical protein
MLHLGGGQCNSLGASVRYARARIEFFASPEGTILLGISATSGSFGRGAQRGQHSKALSANAALATAALTVAALAAICSGFRLLACHCTVRCWGSVHGPCPALRTIAKCDLNKRKLFQIWKKKNTFL